MDRKLNKYIARTWENKNTHGTRKAAKDSEKVTVLCATSVSQVFVLDYSDSLIFAFNRLKQLRTSYSRPMLPSVPPEANFQQSWAPLH